MIRPHARMVLGVLLLAGCGLLRPLHDPVDEIGPLPTPPREFRAAWIATVANIDWPSRPGLPSSRQKAELRSLLDRAVELNLNAVVFQVRPAADALYDSPLEPWSPYLTGTMGRAPEPHYDPLAFAVEEAHKRGLELHAWFNPYRAYHPSSPSDVSEDHISVTNPSIVHRYGDYLWLDPGEPDARSHTLDVILDVVERYDVDGVHFDDYFYPYKAYALEGDVEFPDSAAWVRARRQGVTLPREDWRRRNIDLLIEELYSEIKRRKPHVKFGISPFGIWRPGHPEGVSGFDAYSELYADSRKWLREGWVDYFTPQIYYRIAQHAQPYPIMLRWWIDQNVHRRHIWPGNYTGRVGAAGERRWPADEIPGQIYVTRGQSGSSGNVHFSMRVFMQDPDSLVDRLTRTAYADAALIPSSPWLDDEPPGRPRAVLVRHESGTSLLMTPADEDDVRLWVVREQAAAGTEWSTSILPSGRRTMQLTGEGPVVVSTVDRVGNEGPPTLVQPPAKIAIGDPQAWAAAGEPQASAADLQSRHGLDLNVIDHAEWHEHPPVGHPADAVRRNLAPGDSLRFKTLTVTIVDTVREASSDSARVGLRASGEADTVTVAEGRAIVWNGHRTAVLAVNTSPDQLGSGLVELEIADVSTLPEVLAANPRAGTAEDRLRIPHEIRAITLHHSGSPEPLRPGDDPVEKLRGLQSWGQAERNWWDVPYHYLIDLDGRIYEGRDVRYMGETNTAYDPSGHLLISVLGNYDEQKPAPAQLAAISKLMAWAVVRFDVSLDDIGGHRDWADTSCPGRHLSRYLDDGSLVGAVRARLERL